MICILIFFEYRKKIRNLIHISTQFLGKQKSHPFSGKGAIEYLSGKLRLFTVSPPQRCGDFILSA